MLPNRRQTPLSASLQVCSPYDLLTPRNQRRGGRLGVWEPRASVIARPRWAGGAGGSGTGVCVGMSLAEMFKALLTSFLSSYPTSSCVVSVSFRFCPSSLKESHSYSATTHSYPSPALTYPLSIVRPIEQSVISNSSLHIHNNAPSQLPPSEAHRTSGGPPS